METRPGECEGFQKSGKNILGKLKVSKSRKLFLEFSILPKNERKTKYPESSQDNFFHILFVFWKN